LCVVPIFVPPLRDRPEDIPALAGTFVAHFNAENGTRHRLTEDALQVLAAYSFPGNVRELENAVRRAAALALTRDLTAADFAFLSPEPDVAEPTSELSRTLPPPSSVGGSQAPGRLIDRERLVDALDRSGWMLAKAARLLGLTPRQVGYAVMKHGIVLRKF
jgi:Nif-specific regulatory protein